MRAMVWMLVIFANAMLFAAPETDIAFFRPFARGKAVFENATVQSGECVAQSKHIQREDALRCLVNGRIYDPCFINPALDTNKVVCIASPWNGEQIVLQVNSLPPMNHFASIDASKTYPWAVELVGGEKCSALDGDKQFDNMPIRYECSNQAQLVGHLQRCKAPWSMLRQSQNGVVAEAKIIKAWF